MSDGYRKCPTCNGNGRVEMLEHCPDCDGDGIEKEWETKNERTVEWNKEQSAYLLARIAMNKNLFQFGDFKLASGLRSGLKLECASIAPEVWQGIAAWVAPRLPAFWEVEGVPRGGVPFAAALKPHCRHYDDPEPGVLLIVDDVWTSGSSMFCHRNRLPLGERWLGLVLFARGGAVLPENVRCICRIEDWADDLKREG